MANRKRVLGLVGMVMLAACGNSPNDEGAPNADGAGGAGGGPGSAGPVASASATAARSFGLTDVAYVAAANGPRLLVAGRAAVREDVFVHVEFLDAALAPKTVDDGAGGSLGAIDLHAVADGAGAFFVQSQSTPGFEHDVAALRVTLTDAEEKPAPGEPRVVTFAAPAVRDLGAACDARGFDACAKDALCAPRAGGFFCMAESELRATACTTAPAIDPGLGKNVTEGELASPSLWDAPHGCVQPGALGQPYPEAYVRLHLDAPLAGLSLTTADARTDVDTVLFVVASCAERTVAPIACNDDDLGTTGSRVVLADLAPGDYVVVVQSASFAGGHFRLTASTP